jgi:hypothetical protein
MTAAIRKSEMYVLVEVGWEYDDNYYYKGGAIDGAVGPFKTTLEASLAAVACTVRLAAETDKGTVGFLESFPDGDSAYVEQLKKKFNEEGVRGYDKRLPEEEWELFASQTWFHFYTVIELEEGNY